MISLAALPGMGLGWYGVSVAKFVPPSSGWRFWLLVCATAIGTMFGDGSVGKLRAELTWAQKTVELHADPKTTVIEGRFRFTNEGAKPVDIQQVQTSCGCTTATLEQRHYETGQTGEIVARFTIGERVGTQKKTLLVSTSDGLPTALTLVVYVPELVRVQPAFISWQTGESNGAKIIRVEGMENAAPLEEVTVQSSNRAMTASVRAAAGGRGYELSVNPESTDRPLFASLTIRCRVGSETKSFHAFASVQAPMTMPPGKRPASNSPVGPLPSTPVENLVPPG